jgi:hypothetical protein
LQTAYWTWVYPPPSLCIFARPSNPYIFSNWPGNS